jgi:hypothetical protein
MATETTLGENMKIEVSYYGRMYGTGENAPRYKVVISREQYASGLSVKFQILSPTWGQTDSGDSAALVSGGEIFLPTQQAAALATAILSYLEQLRNQTAPPKIEIAMDEDAPESISVSLVKVSDMARKLRLKKEQIIEDAQVQGLKITGQEEYLLLKDAETIYERLKQKS